MLKNDEIPIRHWQCGCRLWADGSRFFCSRTHLKRYRDEHDFCVDHGLEGPLLNVEAAKTNDEGLERVEVTTNAKLVHLHYQEES